VSQPTSDPAPLLLTQHLQGATPEEHVAAITAAMHTFVQVHRRQPRYLVLHPDDFARLAPVLQQQRAQDSLPEAQRTPITDRVLASLSRGSVLLADTDDPAWDTPTEGS
jgi:hypothetical protein